MTEAPRMLAGRYEIGDLIGRGGMAEVHIGYDTRLGRNVAIKILRADLARDPSFQTRFRREAQAAAGLNHPAIVAVYDTGEETLRTAQGGVQSVPFIVMEYVEGHTVRDILKGDVAAPIEEAVEITAGVLSALDYSHHAGLVHRDIKPANVMLTPTGAVKVMDFGIARALADVGQTMTQNQAVVGTAQYLSPEQARGENVDARSDLYSTGCLLFELLTGRPPFVGDSPVSVAYQHVREQAPKPSEFASDVPAALDEVVGKALRKNRDERYATAQEFLVALGRAMGQPVVGAHASAPESPASGAGVVAGAAAAGAVGGAAAAIGAPGAGSAGGALGATTALPTGPNTGATAVMPVTGGALPGWQDVIGSPTPGRTPNSIAPSGPTTATLVAEDLVEVDDKRRRLIQIAILVGAIIGAVALVYGLFSLTNRGPNTPVEDDLITIPQLAAQPVDVATERLEALGLTVVVETQNSVDVAKDRVIGTDPIAGEKVQPESEVTLIVSSGPDEVEIPDVRGLMKAEAIRTLEALGLTVSTFEVDHDPIIEAERATRTLPVAGEVVEADTEITLYVSDGMVELPDLRNMSETDARSTLVAIGLIPDPEDVETTEYAPGTVFEMNPVPGLVLQKSTVSFKVATAPTTSAVPNVVGKTQSEATTTLNSAGFTVTVVTQTHATAPAGQVTLQTPAANAQAPNGSAVTITVSSGPPPTPGP